MAFARRPVFCSARNLAKLLKNTIPICRRLYSKAIVLDEHDTLGFYNEEHILMKDTLRKIIENDINPYVDEWEDAKRFPAHVVFKKLGNAGFLGVNKPTEFGGLGLDYSYNIAVSEELGNINCGALPMAIGVQSDMATPALSQFGSDKLKTEFLSPTIAGNQVVCLGVSEPSAGSDVANIKTVAEKRGDDLIINGTKMWITNGAQADYMVLLANTNKLAPHLSKSLIVVPMKEQGVKVSLIDKIGMYSSDTTIITLDDVRVPASHIIGEEGKGFIYQMLQFQEERLFAGAAAILPFYKIIRDTADYCAQRKAFGTAILNNQSVHFKLAELETEVEALRSLLYRATQLYVAGQNVTKLASMIKLKTGRLARTIPDTCLQFWGGMGFTSDVLVSRFFRDFRLLSIGGGTDEVMLNIICKEMNILPKTIKHAKK